jgi:hypothetical protein
VVLALWSGPIWGGCLWCGFPRPDCLSPPPTAHTASFIEELCKSSQGLTKLSNKRPSGCSSPQNKSIGYVCSVSCSEHVQAEERGGDWFAETSLLAVKVWRGCFEWLLEWWEERWLFCRVWLDWNFQKAGVAEIPTCGLGGAGGTGFKVCLWLFQHFVSCCLILGPFQWPFRCFNFQRLKRVDVWTVKFCSFHGSWIQVLDLCSIHS